MSTRPVLSLHPAAHARHIAGAGAVAILGGLLALAAWAVTAPLAGAIVVHGVVKVEHHRKTVQHLEGGIVRRILVRDGDRVQAGQTLLVLTDAQADAALAGGSGQLDAEMARLARLHAERDGLARIEFVPALRGRAHDPRVAELLGAEEALFQTRRRALLGQLALLHAQRAQVASEIAALASHAASTRSARELLGEELQANEELQRRNFISRMQVLRLQRTREEYQSREGEARATLAKAHQKLAELDLRAMELRERHRQAAADEAAAAQPRLAVLSARLEPSRDAVRRQAVTAPIAGIVVDLKVFTVGGVVERGAPLLDIVPDDDGLVVEVRLGVDDVQHARAGMPADIRLPAYAQRDAPLLAGTLEKISADRLHDAATGTAHFVGQVRIDEASLRAARAVELRAGLRAEVFLRTGERTAADYLLAPVLASLSRALREP